MAFDSLFIGVTGLSAYQNQIDVISNNIANVGSTGFKAQRVTFQDLLYQTQSFASAPTQTNGGINGQQVGDGVKIASTDTVYTQGGLQTTGINTDLAINGDGFFALANPNGSGTPLFTRDGNFSLNQNGLLYDPTSGQAVLSYVPNAQGIISQQAPPVPIQIPFGLKSVAVGTGFGVKSGPTNDKVFDISMGGNLDQTQYISAVSSAGTNIPLTTISTTLYDSLGGAHIVQIQFQPATSWNPPATQGVALSPAVAVTNINNTPVTAATEWNYQIISTDGTTFSSNSGFMFFDANGQFINTSGSGVPTPASVHAANGNPSGVTGDELRVTQWGTPAGANNATPVPNAAAPGAIGFDYSNVTSLAGAATPNTIAQNGYGAGILSNISIAQDGTINGAFTNGQVTALGKVALATFQNEQGLERVGNSTFRQTANTGTAQYGFAGQGRLGTIISGSLEQSNVSIADEFTKMILAQRSFEANSKSITTADQDLQTVISLKR